MPALRSHNSESFLPTVPTLCSNDDTPLQVPPRPSVVRSRSYNAQCPRPYSARSHDRVSTQWTCPVSAPELSSQKDPRSWLSPLDVFGPASTFDIAPDIYAQNLFANALLVDAFKNYRRGIATKNKREALKWPMFVEWALFRGVARIPPCGKQLDTCAEILNGKKIGRNEELEHFIWQTTGFSRERKQVSSHTQVLRNHLAEKALLLNHFICDDQELARWNKTRMSKGLPPGRIMQGVVGPVDHLDEEQAQIMPRLRLTMEDPEPWAIFDFRMLLCPRHVLHTQAALHIYNCASGQNRTSTLQISSQKEMREIFPELNVHDNPRPMGNTIISVKADIALPEILDVRAPAELAIFHEIVGPSVRGTPVTDTITTFFFNGKAKNVLHDVQRHTSTDHLAGETSSTYRTSFGSDVWVRLLEDIGRRYAHRKDDDAACIAARLAAMPEKPLKKEELPSTKKTIALKTELHNHVVVQQICLYDEEDPMARHHMTLHWRFRLVEDKSSKSIEDNTVPDRFLPQLYWSYLDLPPVDSALPSPSSTDSIGRGLSECSAESCLDGGVAYDPPTPHFLDDHLRADQQLKSPIALRGGRLPAQSASWMQQYDSTSVPFFDFAGHYQGRQGPHVDPKIADIFDTGHESHEAPSHMVYGSADYGSATKKLPDDPQLEHDRQAYYQAQHDGFSAVNLDFGRSTQAWEDVAHNETAQVKNEFEHIPEMDDLGSQQGIQHDGHWDFLHNDHVNELRQQHQQQLQHQQQQQHHQQQQHQHQQQQHPWLSALCPSMQY